MKVSSRSLRVAGLALSAALALTTGCRQVSTWTGPSPLIPRPADPFESLPEQSESVLEPELAPVPDLPAPGHTVPLDPPPAPPPAMPTEARSSAVGGTHVSERPTTRWNLRPLNLLKRGMGGHSVDAPSETAPASSTTPTMSPGWTPEATQTQYTAPRTGLRPISAPPSAQSTFDESYTGPVITPGPSRYTGRDLPIENWPYSNGGQGRVTVPAPVPAAPAVPAPVPESVRLTPPAPELPVLAPPAAQAPAAPSTAPLLLPPDL